MKKNSFISGLKVAFNGIFQLIRHERNFQIHITALFLVVTLGIWLKINRSEWVDILLISSLVISLEAVNTSLEKLCDHVESDWHERIKRIKDIAAGAVLIVSITAIIIGLLIFLPYFS